MNRVTTTDAQVWIVRREIGPASDGRAFIEGVYRWKWRADLAVLWRRLVEARGRNFAAATMAESDWHPWRISGRWVERRVLAPWFAADGAGREQFRGPASA
jgi:hypothetical protein